MATPRLQQFMDEFLVKGYRQPSDATRRSYESALRHYLEFCGQRGPSADTHREYVEQSLKSGYVGRAQVAHNAIKAYHRWSHTPVAEIAMPQAKPNLTYHSSQQVERLLSACQTTQERAVVTCLYESGLRAAELLGIRWSDIDWTRGFVRVLRKGGKVADVPLFPRSKEALTQLRKESTTQVYPFPMDYSRLYYIFRRLSARSGMYLTPHDLRHARASDLRKRGLPLDRIQELLGHTDPKTTSQYYAHLTPHDLKHDIEALASNP